MTNSCILFCSYIMFVLLFLVPTSLLITKQIYLLLETNVSIRSLTNYFNKKQSTVLSDQFYVNLLNFYLERKKIFLSISLSELYIYSYPSQRNCVYKSLGQCYQQSGFFYIAEYYYLLYLSISNDSLSVLYSLLEIYNRLDNRAKISLVQDQISQRSGFNSFDDL
uniref:Ycf37 n=1 Tax=Laurencia catarinensis TaxID=197326 RepID=UPI0028D8CB4F|nr:Ycf37 [Laurencia catarinensis]WMP12373.1 Ycf37 [Laurencia catarinensis]